MTETIAPQLKAAQTELEEIRQWLDWATEVAARIEKRLAEVEAAQSEVAASGPPVAMDGPMALMEGVVVYNVTDYQAAINLAGRAFWQRHGRAPTHVALPADAPTADLKLWTLRLDDRPAPPGCIVVGLPVESKR